MTRSAHSPAPMFRTLAKRSLSLGLYALDRGNTRNSPGLIVPTYHRISDQPDPSDPLKVSASMFEEQLRFLAANFDIISSDDLLKALQGAHHLPTRACLITFDDGWRDNFTAAFPVLKRHRIPALIFLSTDLIGTGKHFWQVRLRRLFDLPHLAAGSPAELPADWHDFRSRFAAISQLSMREKSLAINDFIESLKPSPVFWIEAALAHIEKMNGFPPEDDQPTMLGWDEVEEMAACGITFGSHGKSHAIFTQLQESELHEELGGSKRILEQKLGRSVHFLAYPNGNHNELIVQTAMDAGYLGAFTCVTGSNTDLAVPLELKRINIREDSGFGFRSRFSPLFFRVELSGARLRAKAIFKR
ncbi:MAG: polysaccharide deacetylase family protein [Rhodocyclaceae bacterium]